MIFVTAVELVVVSLLLYFITIQLIIPLWCGTRLFPVLERERKLVNKLTEVRQEVVEAEIEQEIRTVRQEVKAIRTPQQRKERKKHGT